MQTEPTQSPECKGEESRLSILGGAHTLHYITARGATAACSLLIDKASSEWQYIQCGFTDK